MTPKLQQYYLSDSEKKQSCLLDGPFIPMLFYTKLKDHLEFWSTEFSIPECKDNTMSFFFLTKLHVLDNTVNLFATSSLLKDKIFHKRSSQKVVIKSIYLCSVLKVNEKRPNIL